MIEVGFAMIRNGRKKSSMPTLHQDLIVFVGTGNASSTPYWVINPHTATRPRMAMFAIRHRSTGPGDIVEVNVHTVRPSDFHRACTSWCG